MYRNHYDNDVTTFSPQGRLHQVEYALEAVKQGAACVGLRSKTHVVLLAIQRRLGDEMAGHQKKILKLDEHLAIAFSGLTSDARVLSNFLQSECLRFRMLYARPMSAYRAANVVADKAQSNTQGYGARPYGVGMLLASMDGTGAHLYDISPAGIALEYTAHAIGSRSQSARTYLENVREFGSYSLSDLLCHGLRALRATLPSDKTLEPEGLAIAVGSCGDPGTSPLLSSTFALLPRDEIEDLLSKHSDVLAATATQSLLAPIDQDQNQNQNQNQNQQQQQQQQQSLVATMPSDQNSNNNNHNNDNDNNNDNDDNDDGPVPMEH